MPPELISLGLLGHGRTARGRPRLDRDADPGRSATARGAGHPPRAATTSADRASRADAADSGGSGGRLMPNARALLQEVAQDSAGNALGGASVYVYEVDRV